jgi:hypothetical protein
MTPASAGWRTIRAERRVLVVVRTITTLTRLLDVVSLISADRRTQTFFTVDEGNAAILAGGTRSVLRSLDAAVVSWAEATRTTFHLALAASENDDLSRLDAPVVLLPHGVGHQKYYPGTYTVSGLTPERLPDAANASRMVYALSHPDQLRRLTEASPSAGRRARVVGDPALGRMMESRHRSMAYRAALDARGRTLVVLASTWGPDSLLGQWPELPEQLLATLPADEYRVVAVLHPGIWADGPWQVRAWWSRAAEYGLRILPPEQGWQAALLGASCVVSDSGSLSVYAAALDRPVLLAPNRSVTTVPGSAADVLERYAPRLDRQRGLRGQLDASIAGHLPGRYDQVAALAVDAPDRSASRLRSLLYELLQLAEPPDTAAFPAVPVPAREPQAATTMIVSADASDAEVTVIRYPGIDGSGAGDELDYRHLAADLEGARLDYQHLVADLERARLDQVGAAGILRTGDGDPDDAAELLRRWPRASVVAAAGGADTCRLWTRSAALVVRAPVSRLGIDVTVLASWAYVRLRRDGAVPARDRLRLGGHLIDVRAEAA